MKKLLALLAVVLCVVSCQTEPEGLDVNVGGEQEVAICVSLPEATRASDSAEGAIQNLVNSDEYTIRYIFQVFYKGDESKAARQVIYSDGNTVSFPVRLVPGRDYNFVAWADVVPQGDKTLDVLGEYNEASDFRYNTENLKAVTFKGEWKAMDETFDAYTDAETITYYGTTSINLHLTRPFAKLRVMTTDMVELRNLQIVPEGVTVAYTVPVYKSFDVTAQAANTVGADVHTFTYNLSEVEKYTATETTSTLFTNYLFGAENGIVKFTMSVKDNTSAAEPIKDNNFNTDIPVRRNYLTTIKGNILTDGNNVNVTVDPVFENGSTWNPNEDEYDYATISSEAELLAAINGQGGEYVVTSDIDVTGLVASTQAATRTTGTTTPTTTTINLNGKTITVTNKTNAPFATVAAGNTLFLEGGNIVLAEGSTASFIKNEGNVVFTNGTLENESNHNTAAVVEGKVIVEENATVTDNNTTKVEDWLADVLKNGGTYVFTEDMEAGQIKVTATAPVVLDGNGYTFTYTGSDRAIEIPVDATGANVTIKNLNIAFGASYCQRGINFNVTGGTLTIDNVKVSETGTAATYAINLPGSSDEANVTIKNSYLRGNIALNVWGANMNVAATNTEFVSYDNVEAENYAAISVNNDGTGNAAEGTNVNITGGRIVALDEDGNNSYAVCNSTMTGAVSISESTEVIGTISNPVVAVIYEGYNEFYTFITLQDAIDKVCEHNSGSVRLIKDIELSETVTIPAEETIVLDLNGKTITGPSAAKDAEGNRIHVIVNNGSLTVNGEGLVKSVATNGGSAILNNGVLTLNNVTIEGAPSDTDTGTASYAVNTEGEGSRLVVNNSSISGRGAIGATNGTKVELNGGTYHTPAVAWGHAIYANNEGTEVVVNGGTFSEGYAYNASNWGMYQIYSGEKAKVIVNGGDFSQPWDCANGYDLCTGSEGTIEIYGGTFAEDPSNQNKKNFVAEGYKASKISENKYMVVAEGNTVVSTADELVAALEADQDVIFANDIKIDPASMSNAYGTTGINVKNGQTINGNGHTLNINGAGGTWDSGINTTGGLIKDLTVTGSFRGIFINHNSTHSEKVVLENVTITGTIYTISCDQGMYQGIEATDCTFNGWTSYAKTAGEAKFVNCSFGEGSGYKFCRPYSNTEFVNCTFCPGYSVDETQATVTYTGCTWE